VTGTDYGSVRVGAFMGYRIIAGMAGRSVARRAGEQVAIDDPTWRGYLANIAPSLWETAYRDRIPPQIEGAAFLERYGGTTDTVTRVDPARVYAVRQPTAHPIYEHHRVRLFRALLESLAEDDGQQTTGGSNPSSSDHGQSPASSRGTYILLGELMFQSHASYGACGLGSDGTDRLVELVRGRATCRAVWRQDHRRRQRRHRGRVGPARIDRRRARRGLPVRARDRSPSSDPRRLLAGRGGIWRAAAPVRIMRWSLSRRPRRPRRF
jgi:hypothetical protein